MKLIGLKGRYHSGKDTAYEYLRDHNDNVRRESFADRMKLSGVRALGYAEDSVEDAVRYANYIKDNCVIEVVDPIDGFVVMSVTGREFWQRYGTEAHRDIFGEYFWVDALLPRPSEHPSRDNRMCDNADALRKQFPFADALVITDVRFPSEAKRVLALGGEVWAIDADERIGPLPEGSHPSEHPLADELITVWINGNTYEAMYDDLSDAWATYGECP